MFTACPNEVEKMKQQDVPNPKCPELEHYQKVLKASHQAAFNELWGLRPAKTASAAHGEVSP
jgi:hypothetical protein